MKFAHKPSDEFGAFEGATFDPGAAPIELGLIGGGRRIGVEEVVEPHVFGRPPQGVVFQLDIPQDCIGVSQNWGYAKPQRDL